mmetsp:Transcript_35497/g.43854  ORF Transcript_35497/g.43854 Transcript_35497/m.43854 type:complete len:130 (+) Transcript_35497:105-494(+)
MGNESSYYGDDYDHDSSDSGNGHVKDKECWKCDGKGRVPFKCYASCWYESIKCRYCKGNNAGCYCCKYTSTELVKCKKCNDCRYKSYDEQKKCQQCRGITYVLCECRGNTLQKCSECKGLGRRIYIDEY